MNINEINEQAKQSLKKYFRDAYDHQGKANRKELTQTEMITKIKSDIAKQESRLAELRMMKNVLEHDAKGAYEYIFGKDSKKNTKIHHDTLNEMRAKLKSNTNQQFAYVNELKEKALQG